VSFCCNLGYLFYFIYLKSKIQLCFKIKLLFINIVFNNVATDIDLKLLFENF
jgi:hypothetical protein